LLDALDGVALSDGERASVTWLASVYRAGHCAPCRVAESSPRLAWVRVRPPAACLHAP
jgi:hypothetical protein